MHETPVVFEVASTPLVGMLHKAHSGDSRIGVLVMVAGGPQYRIGGHRQLVQWARHFASNGFPVFRFDFRGMGDSYGDYAGFENVELDIRVAIDRFFDEVPSMRAVVLWGECNACSASLFYAHSDARVKGIVMLNPWARTEQGKAKAVVKHYYLSRLGQRSFWTKVFSLKLDFHGSLRSAWQMIAAAKGRPSGTSDPVEQRPLPDRMLAGLSRFKGQLMMVMSGRDLVPKEFDDMVEENSEWKRQLELHGTVRHDLPLGDHTFSSAEWRGQVAEWGLAWLQGLQRISKFTST